MNPLLNKPLNRLRWTRLSLIGIMGLCLGSFNAASAPILSGSPPPYALSYTQETPLQVSMTPTRMSPIRPAAVRPVVVPLKQSQAALMVEALLNNRTRSVFIVDTGATYTSISRPLAESLGIDLSQADTITITTANGRIEVPKIVIDRLNVNGLEVRNVEATVIDVRKGSSFSGLLGLSFIKNFKLTIDPEAGQLIFQQN